MLSHTLPAPGAHHDVVIVGAGAVGLSLAVTLAGRGKRVLVVEGGGERVDGDFTAHNSGVQSGRKHLLGLERGRYKGFGGTTRLWGGQLMPFSPAGFLPDPLMNKPGWLFDLAELEPHYDATLALLGVEGGLSGMTRQWCEKTRRPLEFGPDLQLAPSIWMRQADLTVHFKQQISAAAGPWILLHHEAIGIALDTATGGSTV